MGDFNFDLFKIKYDATVTEYYTTLVWAGLFSLILRLTRVSQANVTLIDHIWSNFADKNVAFGVVQCDLSDHYALSANFPSNSVSKKKKKNQTSPYYGGSINAVLELSLVLLIGTLCVI